MVRRLFEATPPEGQRMLFSATLDNAVNVLVRRFLTEPAQHSVDSAAPPAQISHHLLTVSPADRLAVVCALAGGHNRALVFTRTKHGAHKLARHLAGAGVPTAELHSDLPQGARTRNLASFSSGAVRVMVATDMPRAASTSTASTWSSTRTRRASTRPTCTGPGHRSRGRRGRGDHPADPGPGQRGTPPHAPRGRGPSPWRRPGLAGTAVSLPAARRAGHAVGSAPQAGQDEALAAVSATGPGAAAVSRISGGNRGRRWR
jgi:superfamily II DNA/RNA helicase